MNGVPSQPVSLLGSIRYGKLTPGTNVSPEQNREDRKAVLAAIPKNEQLDRYPEAMIAASHMYFRRDHVVLIEQLHRALNKAVADIVDRWYSDTRADYPSRMPVQANEDKLLRWIDGPGREIVPPYRAHQGNWRPDYLLAKTVLPDGTVDMTPKVCEINARFGWNGLMAVPHWSKAFKSFDIAKGGLAPVMNWETVTEAALQSFDPSKPLHVVNEKFAVIDVFCVAALFQEKYGQAARTIKPSDLHWLPDETSEGGYAVFCPTEDGSGKERVYQVDFELLQEEFEVIPFEVLCRLAPNSVNDFRSTFLVNDQRLLGILYEELNDLKDREVISANERDIIHDSLAPSFLPSSTQWARIIEESRKDPTVKDKWVLKAARDGVSEGHVFGHTVDNEEWVAQLAEVRQWNGMPDHGSFVLQRYIEQEDYEIWHSGKEETMTMHLVSAWFSINGKFLGIGGVRLSDLTTLRLRTGEGQALVAMTDA